MIIVDENSPINGYFGFGAVPQTLKPQLKAVAENATYKDGEYTDSHILGHKIESIDIEKRLARISMTVNLTALFRIKLPVTAVNVDGTAQCRYRIDLAFPEDDLKNHPNEATCLGWDKVMAMYRNQQILENFFRTPGRTLVDSKGIAFTTPYLESGKLRNLKQELVSRTSELAGFDTSISELKFTFATGGYMILALASAYNPKSQQQFISLIADPGTPEEYQGAYGTIVSGLTVFGASRPLKAENKIGLLAQGGLAPQQTQPAPQPFQQAPAPQPFQQAPAPQPFQQAPAPQANTLLANAGTGFANQF